MPFRGGAAAFGAHVYGSGLGHGRKFTGSRRATGSPARGRDTAFPAHLAPCRCIPLSICLQKQGRHAVTPCKHKKFTGRFLQIAHNHRVMRNVEPPVIWRHTRRRRPPRRHDGNRGALQAVGRACGHLNRNTTPSLDEIAGPPARRGQRSNAHAPCHQAPARGVRA
ncbi:hypothetical protein NH44784_056701 [Achromobacter xylosoxidans NH44784-1996]|nr:hypothetical protein NH44784_056701 [Achromobacter xylosoxidans NH44784-1996]